VNNVVDANTDFFITPETVDEHWFFGIGPTKKVIYSYKTAAQGLSLHLNYYYNENLRLQLQFQSTKYQKNIISRDNGMVDSINYQHIRDFRFMIEACY
jgi:hypothetical protein